ncbi:MAG: hypothetical protein IIT65_15230 [Lachnospiraceae bacterium]|nr:hypothetical protein [Lachnospiraceae bacterium]
MTRNEKIAKANINGYEKSTMLNITDAYAKPSTAKQNAFMSCLYDMANNAGWGLKVISYNTFMFTCGYLFVEPETGVVKFKFFTPNHTTVVDY